MNVAKSSAMSVKNHDLSYITHLIKIFRSQWKYTKAESGGTLLFLKML